jgi:hypothetical protein
MNGYETQKERIMELVASAPNQRIRPSGISRQLAREMGTSSDVVNKIIKEMVDEEELVYTYRDPCSYLEMPCNGCEGGHRAARPMKVVIDSAGNPWLCDEDVQATDGLADLNCWDCGDLAFTRSG